LSDDDCNPLSAAAGNTEANRFRSPVAGSVRLSLTRGACTGTGNLHYVPIDFLRDDVGVRLLASGFVQSTRTLVLWEGVTNYLNAEPWLMCSISSRRFARPLIAAIAADRHASEMDLLSDAEAAQDPDAALRLISRHFIEQLATRAGMKSRAVGVQTWAEALHDDEVLRHVRKGVEEPLAKIAALTARAQIEERVVTSIDPDSFARVSIALFHGFVLQKLWDPKVPLEPYLAALDALLASLMVDKQKQRTDDSAESGRS
jgi:BetI-type transcriptional repressor, C-terminal/Leucine carboxyl methyltransferase